MEERCPWLGDEEGDVQGLTTGLLRDVLPLVYIKTGRSVGVGANRGTDDTGDLIVMPLALFWCVNLM